jgi:hypothetical protein
VTEGTLSTVIRVADSNPDQNFVTGNEEEAEPGQKDEEEEIKGVEEATSGMQHPVRESKDH